MVGAENVELRFLLAAHFGAAQLCDHVEGQRRAGPCSQRHFVRALAEVGANVIGVGESPTEMLDDQLKSWMSHYHQVPTVVDVGIMTDAVRWIQDKLWVDRLETTIEAHTMSVAQVRENCMIPGTSVHTAWLCRDKPSMKEALRQAGDPGVSTLQRYWRSSLKPGNPWMERRIWQLHARCLLKVMH